MDPGEPDLDGGQGRICRDRCRSFEGGDRPDVVTERRPNFSKRQLEPRDVRVPEGERRLKVRRGLPVRVERPSPDSGLAECLGGFGVAAGRALMHRDLNEQARVVPAAALAAQQVGRPAMEKPSTGQAGRLVGGVPELRVGEVEGGLRRCLELAHDAAADELLERRDRLVLGSPARPANQLQVE